MTKPIIIDGVDVSECEFCRDNRPYKRQACCGKPLNFFCDSYPNCDFKQLQRLKAENDELKQALEEVREIASTIITEEQTQTYWTCYKKLSDIFEKINEVLKDAD